MNLKTQLQYKATAITCSQKLCVEWWMKAPKLERFLSHLGREVADYPATITEPPVKRRIGAENYINFTEYTQQELVQFMEEVLLYRRKPDVSIERILGSTKTSEEVTSRTFPFTDKALELIAKTIYDLRVDGKLPSLRPSDALNFMNACVQELLSTRNLKVIDSAFAINVLSRRIEYLSGEKEVTI